MSVFTRVTEAELATWLHDYSLGSLLELQGITSGIENTNYFVTTSNGLFVLTLFEKLSSDELPYYLNLMAHLARHGIPCPSPVANRHNAFLGELNGKPACIVSRLPGKSLARPTTKQCETVGAMLGELHIAGQSFEETMSNPRGSAWRERVAQDIRPFLTENETAVLDVEITFQKTVAMDGLPKGAIHADLFRDNVLFDGARIGGLIDFYFACTDYLLYDVAITVNDWCVNADGKLDEKRTQALLRAYDSVRPFSNEERAAWPAALRIAALRFWLSRLYDLHLPRDGEMVHTHDPKQFERILHQHVTADSGMIWL
jgi:homoserine kinase type II